MWAFSFCRDGAERISNQELLSASMDVDGFAGWTKTFVSQFLGKCTLEQYSLRLPAEEKVSIRIIAADRSSLHYPTWPVMEAVIRAVMESSEAKANGGIKMKHTELISKLEERVLEGGQHKFVQTFWALVISKDPKKILSAGFPSGLHCELILAAFLLYPVAANPAKDERLLSIAKVLLTFPHFHPLDNRSSHRCQVFDNERPTIRVSKRLCPACWEALLNLDPVKQFDVCGHHFVPYAVELPSWLPPKVVATMCSKFQTLVIQELQLLITPPSILLSSSGAPRQSQESQSNISVASSYTTDHVGADNLLQSFSSVWSFIKVRLFLRGPEFGGMV
jgi:hypothetical protein